MHRRSLVALAAASAALAGAGTAAVHATAAPTGRHHTKHVLLLSIDGMHQSDLDWYVARHPHSTLARLARNGIAVAWQHLILQHMPANRLTAW